EIFQTPEVMNVKSSYHVAMILCSQRCVQFESCTVSGGRTKMAYGAISSRFSLSSSRASVRQCLQVSFCRPDEIGTAAQNRKMQHKGTQQRSEHWHVLLKASISGSL